MRMQFLSTKIWGIIAVAHQCYRFIAIIRTKEKLFFEYTELSGFCILKFRNKKIL